MTAKKEKAPPYLAYGIEGQVVKQAYYEGTFNKPTAVVLAFADGSELRVKPDLFWEYKLAPGEGLVDGEEEEEEG